REPFATDPELALVLSARAFDLWPEDQEAGQAMLERAREMAFALEDPAVQSDVLNNVAFGEFSLRREWTASMDEALRLANVAGTGAQVGRAYANGCTFFPKEYRFAEGEHYWRDGIAYCDERDIATYGTCLRGHRAVALLDMGRWDEAEAFARRILAAEASPVNLLT